MRSQANWRKRYMVLNSHGVLKYYKKSNQTQDPKGQMHLCEGTTVETCNEAAGYKKKFVFRIINPESVHDPGEPTTMVLSCKSEQERDEWKAQVEQTIAWLEPDVVPALNPAAPAAAQQASPASNRGDGGRTNKMKSGWFS